MNLRPAPWIPRTTSPSTHERPPSTPSPTLHPPCRSGMHCVMGVEGEVRDGVHPRPFIPHVAVECTASSSHRGLSFFFLLLLLRRRRKTMATTKTTLAAVPAPSVEAQLATALEALEKYRERNRRNASRYYYAHREECLANRRLYLAKKKEYLCERIVCPRCGRTAQRRALKSHQRSKRCARESALRAASSSDTQTQEE